MGTDVTSRPWTRTDDELPHDAVVVETKIHDEHGERHVQTLCRRGRLWCDPVNGTYVYYTPTHWRNVK